MLLPWPKSQSQLPSGLSQMFAVQIAQEEIIQKQYTWRYRKPCCLGIDWRLSKDRKSKLEKIFAKLDVLIHRLGKTVQTNWLHEDSLNKRKMINIRCMENREHDFGQQSFACGQALCRQLMSGDIYGLTCKGVQRRIQKVY